MIVRVSAPSRVHLTLLDLGPAGYRRNGGVGFGLAEPRATLNFVSDPAVDLSALTSYGYLPVEVTSLTNRVEQIVKQRQLPHGLRIADVQMPGRHSGFGTGTVVALACIEALFLLNDLTVSPEEIRLLCGRGGASGIGLSSYFKGGFIFDAGRRFSAAPIVGSDATEDVAELPLEMARLVMPDWPIGVLIPPNATPIPLDQERVFFSQQLPLAAEDVFEVTYHALLGTMVAVQTRDYYAFCASINALQRCSWKRAEIDLHGETVRSCVEHLVSIGCDAVAMSSIGPTLIFWAHDFDAVFPAVALHYGSASVFQTRPDNVGRILSHD